jgi:hypothetical protein
MITTFMDCLSVCESGGARPVAVRPGDHFAFFGGAEKAPAARNCSTRAAS